VSQAAKTVVLIGDPQQLDQPTQGSHPEGTDMSALDHILSGERTIARENGLFLEATWRLRSGSRLSTVTEWMPCAQSRLGFRPRPALMPTFIKRPRQYFSRYRRVLHLSRAARALYASQVQRA
jgi:hypothetical protein